MRHTPQKMRIFWGIFYVENTACHKSFTEPV